MPGSTYTVSAQGVDEAGKATTTTTTFRTEAMSAAHRLGIDGHLAVGRHDRRHRPADRGRVHP